MTILAWLGLGLLGTCAFIGAVEAVTWIGDQIDRLERRMNVAEDVRRVIARDVAMARLRAEQPAWERSSSGRSVDGGTADCRRI
jgi:hypothetical protein